MSDYGNIDTRSRCCVRDVEYANDVLDAVNYVLEMLLLIISILCSFKGI